MTLFRRVLAEKRLAFGAAGLIVLADIVLYGLAVQPAQVAVGRARQRAEQATRDVAARVADAETARARLSGIRRTREQLRQFQADVLPRDLAQARDLTYPSLAALADRLGLAMERRTSEYEWDDAARLGRLQATLRLAGRYGDIRRFIEALETGPEFLIIEAISLSRRDAQSDDGLVVSLGVATYFTTRAGA